MPPQLTTVAEPDSAASVTEREETFRAIPLEEASQFRRTVSLIRELAITQFKLKYTGSVLGYVWSLVKPLAIFAIMYFVFAQILKVKAPHFTLQLLVGIVVWTFFAETVGNSTSVIASNGALIRKASFPRSVLVLAGSLAAFFTFIINMALIVVIAAPFGQIELGWRSLLVLPLIAELYILILGLALLLSSLFVFYRDIGHLWEVTAQLLFYASAIVYPLTRTFLGSKLDLIALNPVAQIVEDIRHAIVTPEAPWTISLLGPARFLIPVGSALAMGVLGWVVFHRLAGRFAESL